MKFPMLQLGRKCFTYVVYNEDEKRAVYTSRRSYVQSGVEIGDRHVDAEGNVHLVEEVVIVRSLSLWGIKFLDRWRPVEVMYRYRTPVEHIALEDLKKEMCERTRKWVTEGDLECENLSVLLSRIERTGSYGQLLRLLHDDI